MTPEVVEPRATLAVRALWAQQAAGVDLYAFFIAGGDLLEIAEISRVRRGADGLLQGFQRGEIRRHVRSIVEFLDQGPVLFPNAIILAISPAAVFTKARGTKPSGDARASEAGTLRIPLSPGGQKAAWIVDGQQRALALAESKDPGFPVPVVAFVSEDLETHREQFILVNKARPLPPRLINELLPEVAARLPRDLAPRKIPSELVNLLNASPDSPFRGLIRRPSDVAGQGVVTDTALIQAVSMSIKHPLGALAPYKGSGTASADTAAMYAVLTAYWSAVRDTFPDAWGKPPHQSRLMHSAGIKAMSTLMDRVMSRLGRGQDPYRHALSTLAGIAPGCRWTGGRWPDLDREWNQFESLGKDVRLLSDHLMRLDHAHAFAKVA